MGARREFRERRMHRTRPGIMCAAGLAFCAAVHAGTPVPTYGTYFGGTGDNVAVAVAVDSSANVIVAGYTTSPTLPGTANAYQPTIAPGFPGNQDVFIAKFSPSGALLWTTFLGGNSQDAPAALAVDLAGNIYVTGTTGSSNYPIQAVVSCVPVGGAFNFNSSAAFQQNCAMALRPVQTRRSRLLSPSSVQMGPSLFTPSELPVCERLRWP
jgi:hypothetical protein